MESEVRMSALPFDGMYWKTNLDGDVELRRTFLPINLPDVANVRAGVTYGPASSQQVGILELSGETNPSGLDYTSIRTYLRTRTLAEENIRSALSSGEAFLDGHPDITMTFPYLMLELASDPDVFLAGSWRIRASFTCFAPDANTAEMLATRAASLFVNTRFETDGWRVRSVVMDGISSQMCDERASDGRSIRASTASILIRAMAKV